MSPTATSCVLPTLLNTVVPRERSVLVGLIRVDRAWYVGHPNGEVAWTANLRTAGMARRSGSRGGV